MLALGCAMAKQQSSEVNPAIFSNGVMIAGVIVVRPFKDAQWSYEHALGQSERAACRELPTTGESEACNFCCVTREYSYREYGMGKAIGPRRWIAQA